MSIHDGDIFWRPESLGDPVIVEQFKVGAGGAHL